MRTLIVFLLFLLLLPAVGLGRDHGYYRGSSHSRYSHGHGHHDDGWIVPLAIVGGVLGVAALSQMAAQPLPPPPPQRICRATYNYTDEYGRFLYSRYVDRPCY